MTYNYTTKLKQITANQIRTSIYYRDCSFSCSDYRYLQLPKKSIILRDIINSFEVGKEIGSDAYTTTKKVRFLKTVNVTNSFKTEFSTVEHCFPVDGKVPVDESIFIVKDGGGEGLGEVCFYKKDPNFIDYISAGIICIQPKKEYLFYMLGLLKSKYFKQFIDLYTPQGSTLRHSKLLALDFPIPFPTTDNHKNPQLIQDYISLLVQNIIDKEEQIATKNKLIDQLIEKELIENQKDNKFSYKMPTRNEVYREGRLDTGLYCEEYKKLKFIIENYIEGSFNFGSKISNFKSGETPNYFDSDNGKYIWLSNTNFKKNILSDLRKINTNNYKNLVSTNSIVFSRRAPAGICQFFGNMQNVIVNDGLKVLEFSNENQSSIIFYSLFINSNIMQKIIFKKSNGSIFSSFTNEEIKELLIPAFPQSKQQEIAKEYYNEVEAITELDFTTYLEINKSRNSQLGIFQLNMELFDLRDELETLVNKVVFNKKINFFSNSPRLT